jgi:hypothetical protein
LQLRYYKRIAPGAAELAIFNPSLDLEAGKIKVEGSAMVRAAKCLEDAGAVYKQVMAEPAVYYCALEFPDGWRSEP